MAAWNLSSRRLELKTRIGQMSVTYSSRGIPKYSLELSHGGLKKHRIIRGESESIVWRKAELQVEEWDNRWPIVEAQERDKTQKIAAKLSQEARKALAAERNSQAQKALADLSTILKATLSVDDKINWEELKDRASFPEKPPTLPPALPLPREPSRQDAKYAPELGFIDTLFSARKERKIAEKNAHFAFDHRVWQEEVAAVQARQFAERQEHEKQLASWTARRNKYLERQSAKHAEVDARRFAYEAAEASAIIEYCDLVLSRSRYPDSFPQEFDLDYTVESKTLILDYVLPAPSDIPRLKSVKYVVAQDEFVEQFIGEAQVAKIYDEVLYQIVLRTVHELFESDAISAIEVVVFNGIVNSLNRETGKPVSACILSLRTNRSEFTEINLAQVDPKACFKALKGVGSSKLHGLSPIAPIMKVRRDDGRFVSSYEVANTLDESVNLAAMSWEDFEHLIREVFEQRFSSSGGEVRVTQASRDGGVDAIAFDPDPIRGGKIVIQAKRYTNTVGVGAVRDLYGTVMNEGATKGILVTTSDYGPDAYDFAKGKPLTLLNGANLLFMLEEHGHRARIDLQEAKKLAAEQKRT